MPTIKQEEYDRLMALAELGRTYKKEMEAQAKDANVERLIASHRERANHGMRKYGVTTERSDLDTAKWLQHAQDEAMDLAVYLERLKQEQGLVLQHTDELLDGVIAAVLARTGDDGGLDDPAALAELREKIRALLTAPKAEPTRVTMYPVKSTNVEAIGYDRGSQELHVRFKGSDGMVYVYLKVPFAVASSLREAASAGSFLSKHIKGVFDFEKRPAQPTNPQPVGKGT